MSVREIEAQFALELPDGFRLTAERHGVRVYAAIGAALAVLFGLPIDAPTNIRVRYTDRFQLLEANGRLPREPSPLEVQGALIGAVSALIVGLEAQVHSVDLQKERQTDA